MKEHKIRPLIVTITVGIVVASIALTSGCSPRMSSSSRYNPYVPAVPEKSEVVQETSPAPSVKWYHAQGVCRFLEDISDEFIEAIEKEENPSDLYCLGQHFKKEDSQRAKVLFLRANLASLHVQRRCGFSAEGCELYEAAEDIRLHSKAQVGDIFRRDNNYEEAFEYLHEPAWEGIQAARQSLALMYADRNAPEWLRSPSEAGRLYFRIIQETTHSSFLSVSYKHNLAVLLYHSEDDINALKWFMLTKDYLELSVKQLNEESFNAEELIESNKRLIAQGEEAIESIKKRMRKKMEDNEVERAEEKAKEWRNKWESRKILESAGTGFYVSDSHILTNEHVINPVRDRGGAKVKEECDYLSVMSPTDVVPHFVERTDKIDAIRDLAVLHDPDHEERNVPDRGLKYARLRSQERHIEPGEYVVVTGFPLTTRLALEMHTTTGNVVSSATERSDRRQFVISAPVQSGNSGGPVLDAGGNVIGVVVEKRDLRSRGPNEPTEVIQNLNDAISLDQVREFLDNKDDKKVLYEEATSSPPNDDNSLSVAPIVDKSGRQVAPVVSKQAQGYTVLVECWMSEKD